MSEFHTPVMLPEVIEGLRIEPGKKYIDATVGGGGHGVEIVRRGGMLLGIDADQEAIDFARKTFKAEKNWKLIKGNFRDIEKIAKENGFNEVDGIVFDLGVSSHQLDMPERGFSYRFTDAPLDLRMDQTRGEMAAQLVNRASAEELYEIFTRFAEEELAWPISHRIVRARAVRAIRTTGDVAKLVGELIGEGKKKNATLSRVFQALRIAVNEELTNLQAGLGGAERLLVAKGRLVVISFHSLEDRMVKQYMQKDTWQVVTRKPTVASRVEQNQNPRARSAKLRIAIKV